MKMRFWDNDFDRMFDEAVEELEKIKKIMKIMLDKRLKVWYNNYSERNEVIENGKF